MANGKSLIYHSLVERIGLSTIYALLPEVCEAIVEVLQPEYVRFPDEQDWEAIAQGMFDTFGVPNCLGAIDGKHVRIFAPPHSGTLHYNYKRYHSIILMAAAESNRRITWAAVGVPGSQNDATVFKFSELGTRINNGNANLPPDRTIPGTDVKTPYYFLGDGGFPVKKNIMVPYVRSACMTYSEKKFNKKLSGGRQVIECAFGILANKWKILQQPLNFKLETTNTVVMALVCLHNYIITQQLTSHSNRSYTTIEYHAGEVFILDDLNPEVIMPEDPNDADGLEIRRRLTLYYSSRQGRH